MVDFDLIKGRIQKHRLSSIIHNTLELLNAVQRHDNKSYPVWNLLTLIKWAYIHTTDSILRTPIKEHEYQQLLELIRTFEGKYAGISFESKSKVRQSFKIIANQQFPLQDKFHNSILSRQIVLYMQLQSSTTFNLNDEFKRLAGINLKSFLEYSYFTFFFFNFENVRPDMRYEGDLFESYFTLFRSKWEDEELHKYLDLLTLKERDDFKNLQKLNNEVLQLYETNFFTLKPFILFRNQYRIPHKRIFIQTIKHFIYNYLKENSTFFPEEFGKRLEKYVELGLVENKIPFQNETILKTKYQLRKVSDFLVEPDVLIEVKAIELHPRSGVLRTKDILVNDLGNTIIKAYTQLLETACKINPNNEFYGIIITYKEMYLGFGADAWNEFLKEPIEAFCLLNSIDLSILPPRNLFFINIEDWDYMMQSIKDGNATLKSILMKAQELNALDNPVENVMLMEQVITKHFLPSQITLAYLKDKHLQLNVLT
ncbi:hypothetical protein [Parafilimonas terrae]|uniref:Restriction endonuclease n=1 Tax=Parafilimonas terrae TaxID=1465490 RepID=A0A1I5TBN5_9BACT|nr:hypothetical protein [Parafilimonas terrae]SFP80455.1 hypothetical protein SAMN05444277_10237 [Parafilimonas terrae]